MDRALNRLVEIGQILRGLGAQRRRPREQYTDATIVLIHYWAVLSTQTHAWACDPSRWPLRLPPGGLPSPSRFSRRINSPRVRALLDELEAAIAAIDPVPADRLVTLSVDARPLVIGSHSHDPHAGYGRAAGGKGRGYKFFSITDDIGRTVAWRLGPMNKDEREMARRMLRDLAQTGHLCGYLLGDKNFDSNDLFAQARAAGLQLAAPRRHGPGKGLGHRVQDPGRLRCRDLLENTVSEFGRDLHHRRGAIERSYGLAACTPELLTQLPPWVRRRHRVERWVQAKVVIQELHRLSLQRRRRAVA